MGLGSWLSGKVFLLLRVRQSNFPRSFVTRIFSLHQEAGQGRGGRVGVGLDTAEFWLLWDPEPDK